MLIMHVIFFLRSHEIVVALVTEIIIMLQKHIDPDMTQKEFKLAMC